MTLDESDRQRLWRLLIVGEWRARKPPSVWLLDAEIEHLFPQASYDDITLEIERALLSRPASPTRH